MPQEQSKRSPEVLCVDLDGTLLKTDLFYEGVIRLLKRSPLAFLKLLWIIATDKRSVAKHYLAERVNFSPEDLPISTHFFHYLLEEQRTGRKLILVTASPELWAKKIAEYFGIFDQVIASTENFNCKGNKKLEAIRGQLGSAPFEYAGNESADLPIWEHAAEITVVTNSKELIRKIRRLGQIKYLFDHDLINRQQAVLKAIRVHQWVKNLLVFLPLILAHQILSFPLVASGLLSFFVLSFAASAVYLLNDLFDLDADRLSKSKKLRPLASGNLSIRFSVFLIVCLLCVSGFLASLMPVGFVYTLLLYLLITTLYTFNLKKVVILDVIVLSGLYSLRIIAGGFGTGIAVSDWLIAFSGFFFFSLACLKRYTELQKSSSETLQLSGRGYYKADQNIVMAAGVSTGLIATLVMALYTTKPAVSVLYDRPVLLWLICPVLLYWLLRAWILAQRKQINDDPVMFAIKDLPSYLVILLILMILVLASF